MFRPGTLCNLQIGVYRVVHWTEQPLPVPEYVAYYRISPGGRRKDKAALQADVDLGEDETLGLEAQRRTVIGFLRGELPIAEFTEIETGKKNNRPRLLAALDECRRLGATLLIAKLDRLARNVHFITGLMEGKVPFIAVDMPDANEMTIHIIAAVAQGERVSISKRVTEALEVLKRRGAAGEQIGTSSDGRALYSLGNPSLDAAREASRTAPRSYKKLIAPSTRLLIKTWRGQGWSLPKIAAELNTNGIAAAKGGKWYASAVMRVVRRQDNG